MLAFCLIYDVFKHTIEFILDVLFSLLLLSCSMNVLGWQLFMLCMGMGCFLMMYLNLAMLRLCLQLSATYLFIFFYELLVCYEHQNCVFRH